MAETITPLIQDYTVDFASNNNFLFVKGVQYDGHSTRYANVVLLNNGQPYELIPEEVTVTIRGTKPDTKIIFNECEIIDINTIQFEITPQMSAVSGKGDYEISIMSNTENRALTSFPFYIVISKASFPANEVISSNEFGILIDKINQVSKVNKEVITIKVEMQEVTKECIDATKDCNDATDASKNATKEMQDLHKIVSDAEDIRIDNENKRKSNEDVRIANESDRESAEFDRELAESDRESNEDVRIDNEDDRIANEKDRDDAEKIRISNEKDRVDAENLRNDSEKDRDDAEKIRIANEKIRVDNEKKRVTAETARDTAETTRITNETNRQTDTAKAIKDAQDATKAALDALKNIQGAIGIDDTQETLTSAWSSSHTKEEIDKAKRFSLSNIVITPSDWVDKKIYIKSDKITLSSIIDIYFSPNSFEIIDEMDLHYSQGNGFVCIEFTYENNSNIVIDNIMIENYYLDEPFTIGGTV